MSSALRLRSAALLSLTNVALGSCAFSSSAPSPSAPPPNLSMSPPSPDPREAMDVGLAPSSQAAWNLRILSNTPPSEEFVGAPNTDLAFKGKYAIQGNYNGYQIWDISNPGRPSLETAYLCPASQSDVSIYQNLLFVSGEGLGGRVDCGVQGIPDSVSVDRLRGIRIFDVRNMGKPRYVTNVQTCRGSHTHTVVTDPNDAANVYIYVSGSAGVRSPRELPGCSRQRPGLDPNSALFRIEVIRVPLAAPQRAEIVSSPRILDDLAAPPGHGQRPSAAGPSQCHDITAYPTTGLAGAACGGYGLLLDIRDVANPVRLEAVADSNFSYWHSATFNNDGSKVLFTDEWGGGVQPRCRATDKYEWGADAIFTVENSRMVFKSYYKMPAIQTAFENCVAHNGSLIPIPARDVMVQSWYQGGISVFDWTDPAHPMEIAYFDRRPLDVNKLVLGGTWSAYWYNGVVVSSEITRGLDVLELTPSGLLSQNEIDAAKTVRLDYLNVQDQPRFVWPPSFALARAYLDQLARANGLATGRVAAVRAELVRVERLSGRRQRDGLTELARQLDRDVPGATDQAKARLLADAVGDLARERR